MFLSLHLYKVVPTDLFWSGMGHLLTGFYLIPLITCRSRDHQLVLKSRGHLFARIIDMTRTNLLNYLL